MYDLFFVTAQFARQAHGHFGDALGVSFSFAVAQVERQHPAFDGFVVGFLQAAMRLLQGFLRLLALGDVTGGCLKFPLLTVAVTEKPGGGLEPDVFAVFVAGTIRCREVDVVWVGVVVEQSEKGFHIFGVDELLNGPAHELFGLVSQQSAAGRGNIKEHPVGIML